MLRRERQPYANTKAVLTSMHAKERVIAPILQDELGLSVEVATGINTDQFGTFSREVDRTSSQLDAARAKIAVGFEYAPLAPVGLASGGSFGPHPLVPLMAVGHEIVLLIDRETGLELTGVEASPETNFAHGIACSLDTAIAFAQRVRFPDHGLIVMGCRGGQPAPDLMLNKNITDFRALEAAVQGCLKICGAAFVETDMRANRNPTRLAAIERATRDLVRRFHNRCPNCDYPGFDVTDRIRGMPCGWCGEPTRVVVAEVLSCRSCGHRNERLVSTSPTAQPSQCGSCNP